MSEESTGDPELMCCDPQRGPDPNFQNHWIKSLTTQSPIFCFVNFFYHKVLKGSH